MSLYIKSHSLSRSCHVHVVGFIHGQDSRGTHDGEEGLLSFPHISYEYEYIVDREPSRNY